MNDFTKEELQSLICWGEVYTEFGNSWNDKIHRPILDKIQFLIKNYDAKLKSKRFCEICGLEL